VHTSNPDNWIAPTWHPDFGNAEEELHLLRDFCVQLIQQYPTYSVELALPEDGYMNIDIFLEQKTKIGELFVVAEGGKRRYGLFLSRNGEEEYYFDEVHQGLEYFGD